MSGPRRLVGTLVVLALAVGPPAAVAAAPHSPDDLAPPDAPPHWLPPEPWIYNHWLPFDEERLYRVLHITRAQLWVQLRDDHRTLAGLAARHGHRSPARLARALVAGRAGLGRGVGRAELERRAQRVITQGHLAQHLFFHSLHQFAIPSAAPEIFGVTDIAFRGLRRDELSPLDIARLHGRSPGSVEGQSIAVLRERVRFGVHEGDLSAGQARILFRRQLTQLPRWLDQARYNGPPKTHLGALVAKPRDYASNPQLSRDGRVVAYEAYRQKLPLAVKLGEIAVLRADLRSGTTRLVSPVPHGGPTGPDPISAYNPTISGDGGRIAFEASRGNQNFAKRYGRIGTLYCDLASHDGASTLVDPDRRAVSEDSRSSYNPALAADGRSLAFEAVRGGRTVVLVRDGATGATRTAVRGTRSADGYGDPYEPGLSADGTRVVYTRASGTVGHAAAARSTVRVRELPGGRETVLPGRDAGNPALSADGRWVAYTSGRALVLYDLEARRARTIPVGAAVPLDPSVADGGVAVAFTAVRGARSVIAVWRADTGAVEIASRAGGAAGAVGDGEAQGASISGDGTRVAFASTATNLDPAKRDDTRAVYLRDLSAQSTRLVSDPAVAYAVGS